ncbi:TPA: hypothetical protein KOU56_003608 [Clostridioides difficile]|nr:hypothetical protein [Clostridioides difficile]
MKKTKLKVLSLTLATTFLISTTVNSYAISAKSSDMDMNTVADVLTVSEEYSNALKDIGISVGELKDLTPKGSDFIQKCNSYLEKNMDIRKTYSEEPIKHTTNASQLSYAMSAARKNQEVGAPKYNDEVVYMYLSHFVDFEGDNYEEGLCTYITKYDREAYDRYLSRGSTFRSANSMRSVITNLIALKGDLPSLCTTLAKEKASVVKTIVDMKSFEIDVQSVKSMVENDMFIFFKDAYSRHDTPEAIIEDVQGSMKIKYKDYNEQIGYMVLGLVFSALTFTPPVMAMLAEVNLYSMVIKDIFDKANYAALQYSRSARKAERFNLWMEENGMYMEKKA